MARRSSVSTDPKRANIYQHRGVVYSIKGDKERAIADYDQALALEPNATSYYYYYRGIAKLKKGDTVGGKTDISSARKLQPDIGK
jgi:lipoprotein NlpI